jgi:putative NADH-flavin reductase
MTEKSKDAPLDPYKDIMGVDFTPERLGENLQAFAGILEAIKKLRELDMTNVHPSVIFDPTDGYDEENLS